MAFCFLPSHALPWLDDTDFYEKQLLLPNDQMEPLVTFLKRLLFRLCWSDYEALSAAAGSATASSGILDLLDLRTSAVQVWRNDRLSACVSGPRVHSCVCVVVCVTAISSAV